MRLIIHIIHTGYEDWMKFIAQNRIKPREYQARYQSSQSPLVFYETSSKGSSLSTCHLTHDMLLMRTDVHSRRLHASNSRR
jgi:hypothetical protein